MTRRLHIPTMKALMERRQDLGRRGVNQQAHDQLHGPSIIVYQTAETLDTDAGPGLRLPRGGQITRLSGRVATASTSGNIDVGVYIDGVDIFGGSFLVFQEDEKVARPKIVRRPYFNEDSVFTVQIDDLGTGSAGPMILTIEYMREY